MKKFISLSKYPGQTGQHFYTEFFNHHGIEATYEPRACDNLKQSLDQALAEGVEGISISMPFKQEVIQYLDYAHTYVTMYQSCNTIKVVKGQLHGYNTDLAGVDHVCKNIKPTDRISVLGLGAMGSMFVRYLEHDYPKLKIFSRNSGWQFRHSSTDVVINCTALGTIDSASPFEQMPEDVRLVIDLALKDNDLQNQCLDSKIKYITGGEFYQQQFFRQFELYTGIRPDKKFYQQAEELLNEKV